MNHGQIQYQQRFGPIDVDAAAPDTTIEVFRPQPQPARRRFAVALLTPSFFFVDAEVAPIDTGEWQFQPPQITARQRLASDATFQPIEVETDSLRGLELSALAQPTRRKRVQGGESFFAPPHVDVAPVDAAEWAFNFTAVGRRARPWQGDSVFAPPHVDQVADPGFEWIFPAQLPITSRSLAVSQMPQLFDAQLLATSSDAPVVRERGIFRFIFSRVFGRVN